MENVGMGCDSPYPCLLFVRCGKAKCYVSRESRDKKKENLTFTMHVCTQKRGRKKACMQLGDVIFFFLHKKLLRARIEWLEEIKTIVKLKTLSAQVHIIWILAFLDLCLVFWVY